MKFWYVKCINKLNLNFIATKFQLPMINSDAKKKDPS